MVIQFEDPFEDETGVIDDGSGTGPGDGGQGGGGGVTQPPVEERRIVLLSVPTGQYRKTRHSPTLAFVNPVAGAGVNTEAQELIPGPAFSIGISDKNAQYRIVGFFPFDNAEYDFMVTGPKLFRVLIDGNAIVDDFIDGPSRTRTKIVRVPMTAGNHQVEINFGFEDMLTNTSRRIAFNIITVPDQGWVSCDDGLERPGDPPIGWIQTVDGCFKPPLSDEPSDVDLLDVVQVSTTSRIERTYILESGTALTPHRMSFFNRAENMSVLVQLTGPKPVKFVTAFQFVGDVGVGGIPSDSFELQPKQERLVDMLFIQSELDVLPEGLVTSEVLIALDPGTITLARDGDEDIDVGRPRDEEEIELPMDEILPPEEEDVPTPTWRDCSGITEVVRAGFPPDDFILRADGCYIPEPIPEPTPTLTARFVELTPGFEDTRAIARARLSTFISNLGSTPESAFTYRWNFDKQNQGAGTGDTTARVTEASWRMTESDLRRLEDPTERRTTRTVEIIASAGNKIVRSTLSVTLDDQGLVFISPPVERRRRIIPPPVEDGREDSGGGRSGRGGRRLEE